MYLKSIEVQGFKSFANKIVFEFHNGITGIVGPNGSGKSNVGDAVRWVLGEQSARQLRGGNMQDVIFSGTETRKPLGFASVAITLDNSDHKLEIDFEEVTVTRRLYRSGESEYLLNGVSCRLKDIQELFYDTGIGKDGYSIIGQGQIDKILSGRPEERRELFDEAAGIVKFKRRKTTAIKKLEDEQRNLVRVTDILAELTKQLGPLETQAEKAKTYLKKREELKILDLNLFLVDMEHIRLQLTQLEQAYQIATGQLQDNQAQFDKVKSEYERVSQSLEQLEQKMQEARTKLGQNRFQKQQLEHEIAILQEQIRAGQLSSKHYQERLLVISAEIKRKDQEVSKYQNEKSQLETRRNEILQKQETQQKKLNVLKNEITQCEGIISRAKSEMIELLNQRASTKGKMQRYDAMLEQIGIRKAKLNQRVLKLKSDESEQLEFIKIHRENYKKLNAKRNILEQKYKDAEEELSKLRTQIDQQSRESEQKQSEYHKNASRLESLRNMSERYDGYGNSIRLVMAQKERQAGIHGVVADLIKVEQKYELAIETALGGSLQNIVTDNDQTAKYLIEFLKRNRYGRATFLPLTNMRTVSFGTTSALREVGVLGLADTLVETDKLYRALMSQLLGRTLVVDTIDHAISIARKYNHTLRIVTLDGESLSPGGSMTGGAFKNNSNLLGRKREIEELEASVDKMRLELQKLQASIVRNRDERTSLRDKISEWNAQIQNLQLEQNTEQMNISQAEVKLQEIRSGYTQLKLESKEIEEQIGQVKDNNEEIQKSLEASLNLEKSQEVIVEQQQAVLEKKQEQETRETQLLNSILLEVASIEQKRSFLQENLSRIAQEKKTLVEEEKTITDSMKKDEIAIKEKELDILEKKELVEQYAKMQEEDGNTLELLETQREELNKKQKDFFQQRDELSEQVSRMDKECFRLSSQKEKVEEQQANQIQYLWEEYEVTPSQAYANRMEGVLDRTAIRKNIEELKGDIRKLGNVNVNAIEEYKEVSKRHTFLSEQHNDLVEAAETLKGIIAELDAGMKRQFTEKFAQISQEFDKVFQELFGGGKGTLELVADEDILEADIRITSQPPGKKLQHMMQLSGGEKALTAIALLFAIQNLKPSPFCLLDEIEAALDDSNVTRFAKYLHKLTQHTQFIVITHRRGTMSAADRLYGITMQEKGVSTLVSVNLIEDELE